MIASIAHTGADLADTQPPREWRFFYHANIFNPMRVKVHAIQAEVPKGYWRNPPEATLIIPARFVMQRKAAAHFPPCGQG
jgi:hypothetical protein